MEHELFIVEQGRKRFGYTRPILEEVGYTSVDGSVKTKEGSILNQETFERKVDGEVAGVLTGTWCSFETKEEWLDGDNQAVETRITDQRAPFTRHGERWESVVVETGVTKWNLDAFEPKWTRSEAGLAQMPLKLSQLIKALVVGDLYGDNDDPLFQTPSSKS